MEDFGDAGTYLITRDSIAALPDKCPAQVGYVMFDDTIRTAVAEWTSDATAAEAEYGHISTWDTSGVTDMSMLFCVSLGSTGDEDDEEDGYWNNCPGCDPCQ